MVFLVSIYQKIKVPRMLRCRGERDRHRDLNIAILANIRMVEAKTRIVSVVS
jgi:hypothetical protein